ncbi:MAG TPA: TIGR01777 family oxidoreductase [Chthoniobacterales bacterium]|jgi:hypothetical protein
MRIGITGVTGLIGQALAPLCKAHGHDVTGFSRTPHSSLPHCDHVRQFILEKPVNLSGLDAVIHLAGEPVIGLWTAEKRRRIVASRRETTRHLVASLSQLPKKPGVFLCASGTGFYGHRGAETLVETSGSGSGFLSEVAQVWEDEAFMANALGIRTCALRTGLVLSNGGGGFSLLRRVFGLGLGGKIGSGEQYLPWIHIADMAALYLHAVENEQLSGPVNAVAPEECTNAAFTRALGSALHRPTIFGVPAFAISMALGDLSRIVLDSQRVQPAKALESGFAFRFPTLSEAFSDLRST